MGICIRLWNANSIQIHLVQFQAIPLSFTLLTTLTKIVDIMCNIYGCISCVCVCVCVCVCSGCMILVGVCL